MTAARVVGPAVAGSWYPAQAAELTRLVDELLDEVAESNESARALIVPHAGFVYSGRVAAAGFAAVRRARFARVVLIGPSHYVGFRGAALADADAYRTPLGDVPLDPTALERLRDRPGFSVSNDAFRREHSLEAELPFLQRALEPGFRLVPVLIGGGSSGAAAQQVADGLRPLVEKDTLVVVSSDFTHFGASFGYRPFRDDVAKKIEELDMGAVRTIETGDVAGFEEYLERTGATVCGRDAIDVLLRMLGPGERPALVAYDTSGRMTGSFEHSVSYAALVVPRARAEGA